MNPLPDLVASLGHVVRSRTLRRLDLDPGQLTAALRAGSLRRIRPGWFATPDADSDQLRAAALGGRLGCASALRRWGAWGGRGAELHVHVPPTASRLSLEAAVSARVAGIAVRHPEAVPREDRRDTVLLAPPGPPRVHWRVLGFPQDALDWIVSPRDALLQALTCLDEEDALACLDSAVHEGAVSPAEIAGVLARAPERLRPLQREMDPLADSGLETIVRRRLRRAGFSVRPQVHLPGIGWIDLLVEEILAIEIDGYEWHSSRERFHADVDRAVREQAFGLRTLRFGQRHVFEEWPLTLSAIERQVRER